MNFLKFTKDKLNVEALTDLAASPSCGAISVFIGTTRDNFEDKTVVTLEYEAYEAMGLKAFGRIAEELRAKWPDIENVVIYHRLGTVPVREASVVIAVSSPHRKDAIHATEWCIDEVKKSAPIWKKEVYANRSSEWKENKESSDSFPTKTKKFKTDLQPEISIPPVSQNLIQIKVSNEEINRRIESFMERKRTEINLNNIREFCLAERSPDGTCARVDAIVKKRADSKGHLQVNRVLNSYWRDQTSADYLMKYIPSNGIEERVENLELQLSLTTPVPINIYTRLRKLEDRMMFLESISPEYINFWDKTSVNASSVRKRTFSVHEIDAFIADLEKKANKF